VITTVNLEAPLDVVVCFHSSRMKSLGDAEQVYRSETITNKLGSHGDMISSKKLFHHVKYLLQMAHLYADEIQLEPSRFVVE
jgi:hypothetical protein